MKVLAVTLLFTATSLAAAQSAPISNPLAEAELALACPGAQHLQLTDTGTSFWATPEKKAAVIVCLTQAYLKINANPVSPGPYRQAQTVEVNGNKIKLR